MSRFVQSFPWSMLESLEAYARVVIRDHQWLAGRERGGQPSA
ncbi:MAG: hypothetical protein ACPGUC_00740 [Gammaproteobacteria bacterium]